MDPSPLLRLHRLESLSLSSLFLYTQDNHHDSYLTTTYKPCNIQQHFRDNSSYVSSEFIMTTNTNARMESRQGLKEFPYKYSKQTISSSSHPSQWTMTKRFPRRNNLLPSKYLHLTYKSKKTSNIDELLELQHYKISEQFQFFNCLHTLFILTRLWTNYPMAPRQSK